MSPLQWALLVVGAIAVVAIYWYSRRETDRLKDWNPSGDDDAPVARPPRKDQLDMFSRGENEFDEFGVGRPRKRTAPTLGAQASSEHGGSVPAPGEAAPAPAEVPQQAVVEDKIVTLLIAEVEGTAILGPRIHQALAARGLVFGDHRIYHKQAGDETVFSVASLVKPGVLDPAEQASFSTPGLSMFMVLPGPRRPQAALQDMIATALTLASQLNAQVFDASRQPFDDAAQRALTAEVDSWAQRHGL